MDRVARRPSAGDAPHRQRTRLGAAGLFAAVLAAGVAVGGCGGSDTSTSPSNGPVSAGSGSGSGRSSTSSGPAFSGDPCSLLTQVEAAAALTGVGAGITGTTPNGDNDCEFRTGGVNNVLLVVFNRNPLTGETTLRIAKRNQPAASGAGDEAYVETLPRATGFSVYVRKGSTIFSLTVIGGSNKDAAVAAARAAAMRI